MIHESFKTFKTKLLTFFSNKIIECNFRINEYTTDIYFPEYNITVQIYDVNEDILHVIEFEENTNCILINVNLTKRHFDSFTEIIKIKNSLIDVIKNKLSDNDKLIIRLNSKIKEMQDILIECRNLIICFNY